KQIFQRQTVAELATVVGSAPEIAAEQGLVSGPVPLTPIQHWFFAQELSEPHHFNQALLLTVQRPLDPALLEQALAQLLVHHDALRLRFTRDATGWQQTAADVDPDVPLALIDLAAVPEAERQAALEAQATAAQASLDLERGPLVRALYFDMGAGQAGRLLLVVHHLAVDGVSWRVLLDDLNTAYEQFSQGQALRLPPKTTSFQQWARRLVAYAQSSELRDELAYWLADSQRRVSPLPVDFAAGDNTVASARAVALALSAEETQALIYEVPAAYRTQINDVL